MEQWLSAKAIADLGLPELPRSKQGVIDRARSDCWSSRPRKKVGGGIEYHVSSLPAEALEELRRREIATSAPVSIVDRPARQLAAEKATALKGWQRETMIARLSLVREAERLAAAGGLMAAYRSIAEAAAAGTLSPALTQAVATANNRKGDSRGLSVATLRRWRDEYVRAGRDELVLAPRGPGNERIGPPDWLWPLMKHYAKPSWPSLAWAWRQFTKNPPEGVSIPSLSLVEKVVRELGPLTRNRGRMTPAEMRALRVFTVRDDSMLEPLDVITADGHTFKAKVRHPFHGGPFRPELVTVLDVATRFATGWSAGLAESAWVVADALRVSATSAGLGAILYSDNGAGFVADVLTGSNKAVGILNRMGTRPETAIPGNAQARGVIERFQRTCWGAAAKELPSYAGKQGSRDAARLIDRRIRADYRDAGSSPLVMPWTDFLIFAQQKIDEYNDTPHSHLPRVDDPVTGRSRHQTPRESWNAWLARGWQPPTLPASAIEDLFRPYEICKVTRGQVTIGGNTYFSRELEAGDWHGEEVLVGYDIHDPSKVWVRTHDERLICEAALDANKVAIFPKSRIEQSREQRAERRLKLLESHADEVRAELNPGVIEHMVPAETLLTPTQQAIRDEMIVKAGIPSISPTPRSALDEKRDTYRRWLTLDSRIAAGEQVDEDAAHWHRVYQLTSEWKVQRDLIERGVVSA